MKIILNISFYEDYVGWGFQLKSLEFIYRKEDFKIKKNMSYECPYFSSL